jgi:hypothetical protein
MPGLRWFKLIAVTVVTAVAITVAGAGIAAASGAGSAPARPASLPAGTSQARSAVACHLWVVVNATGHLARTGCPGTTVLTLNTGSFRVVFPVKVSKCAYAATMGLPGSTGLSTPGFITAQGAFHNRRGVFVSTYNTSGSLSTLPFHLIVAC